MIGILRKVKQIFPSGLSPAFVSVFMLCYPVAKGITVRANGEVVTLSKGKRTMAIRKNELSPNLLMKFDQFFEESGKDSLDFTKPVETMGLRVTIDAMDMLMIKPIFMEYNKDRPLKEGDVVFDCGGHHGLYSIIAARQVGASGKVYCFEPDEGNCRIAEGNIRGNGLKNVILVKKGVWNEEKAMPFASGFGPGSQIVYSSDSKNAKTTIETTTIDAFVKQNGIKRLDFIKMDIGGAEIEAIQGAETTLKTLKPSLAIASYHRRNGELTCFSMEKQLKGAGYVAITGQNSAGETITYAHKD